MSSCIEDLLEHDLIKKCSKCGIISLKRDFHENKITKDGLGNHCRKCWKQNYLDNRDNKKQYCLNTRYRIKEYC